MLRHGARRSICEMNLRITAKFLVRLKVPHQELPRRVRIGNYDLKIMLVSNSTQPIECLLRVIIL